MAFFVFVMIGIEFVSLSKVSVMKDLDGTFKRRSL